MKYIFALYDFIDIIISFVMFFNDVFYNELSKNTLSRLNVSFNNGLNNMYRLLELNFFSKVLLVLSITLMIVLSLISHRYIYLTCYYCRVKVS